MWSVIIPAAVVIVLGIGLFLMTVLEEPSDD